MKGGDCEGKVENRDGREGGGGEEAFGKCSGFGVIFTDNEGGLDIHMYMFLTQVHEEAEKELQERLDINLESSMKNEEEYEQKIAALETKLGLIEGNLKESEDNLSSKAEELRDANEKVEDLQNCLEQMQSSEGRLKEMKDLLDQKV